jgi:RNA polymerase sigma factor (sigma-70 family)
MFRAAGPAGRTYVRKRLIRRPGSTASTCEPAEGWAVITQFSTVKAPPPDCDRTSGQTPHVRELTRRRGSERLAGIQVRPESTPRQPPAHSDAATLAAVYDRHHQALYRYCRSILHHHEDAQDALQSTMEHALAAHQRGRREVEWRPWLFRIAHNEAISILRRRRRTTAPLEAATDDQEMDDRVAAREQLRALDRDLADLSERQRAALVLRELNGLGHREIAELLGCSPATVKQAIFDARSALHACREGREMACHDVQRSLSDGDARLLRGRRLRAHLRACADCQRFRVELTARRRMLRGLGPPFPAGGAALEQIAAASGGWPSLVAGGVMSAAAATQAIVAAAVVATTVGTAALALPGSRPAPVPARSVALHSHRSPAEAGGQATRTPRAESRTPAAGGRFTAPTRTVGGSPAAAVPAEPRSAADQAGAAPAEPRSAADQAGAAPAEPRSAADQATVAAGSDALAHEHDGGEQTPEATLPSTPPARERQAETQAGAGAEGRGPAPPSRAAGGNGAARGGPPVTSADSHPAAGRGPADVRDGAPPGGPGAAAPSPGDESPAAPAGGEPAGARGGEPPGPSAGGGARGDECAPRPGDAGPPSGAGPPSRPR